MPRIDPPARHADSDGLPVLAGVRATLRGLREDDAEALFALHSDPRAMRYWSFVPWTDRSPEEVVRDQVRFSLTPIDGPDTDQLRRVIDHLGSDQVILFSTDYPHNQFEGADPFPSTFDPALRSIIAGDAPFATYARLGGAV